MALDQLDRGFLDKEIDHQIEHMISTVQMVRDTELSKMAMIKNEADFALGFTLGEIIRAFVDHYYIRHQRVPPEEDQNEAVRVLKNRIGQIKEAILNCG